MKWIEDAGCEVWDRRAVERESVYAMKDEGTEEEMPQVIQKVAKPVRKKTIKRSIFKLRKLRRAARLCLKLTKGLRMS
jgi:hypothetical protein